MTNENTIGYTGALELDLDARLVQTKMQRIKDFLNYLLDRGNIKRNMDNNGWN